jgi:steroid 5-alpha reductase family enzyme
VFWISQAVTVWALLIPSLLAFRTQTGQQDFAPLTIIGAAIWAAGLLIEATADLQKFRFNQNPANKGTWIESGIWRYSRHPNYFGEILIWIGIYIFTLQVLTPVQALAGLVSPLFIMILLLFISGIPPLEKFADARWGDQAAYKQYKKHTSILIPLPKRRGK